MTRFPRDRERATTAGMTLLEVLIVLGLVAVIGSTVVISFRSIARSELRGNATKLAGAIRYLFDRASTTGKIHRLVIDLDAGKYWAEVTDGRVYQARDKETEETRVREAEALAKEQEEERKKAEEASGDEPKPIDIARYQPTEFVPKRARFEGFKETALKPVTLKTAKIASFYTPRLQEPLAAGKAYLYFYPLGQTEPALIHVSDKERKVFYSLLVHPLTGHVKLQSGYIEPRIDEQYDDEGNRIER